MKAPSFWFKPNTVLAAQLLTPASWLYRLGGTIRRWMAQPYRAKIPVICIGNIVAGGAGKTPVALSFALMLQQNGAKPVFVTRGYGGSQNGPLRVDPAKHTAHDVGDEALLLARTAPVWIGHDRAAAIKAAEGHGTHVILDDGLQNPSVLPNLAFLVIDGDSGLGNGKIIPAGPLREKFARAMQRVTAVIMIGERDEQNLAPRIKCPILRANWQPNLSKDFPRGEPFFAFAGIGRPTKFYETCRAAELNIVGTQDFPDHHMFSERDLKDLVKEAKAQNARLLTTEKDWVRLSPEWQNKIIALPVTLIFDDTQMLTRLLKH